MLTPIPTAPANMSPNILLIEMLYGIVGWGRENFSSKREGFSVKAHAFFYKQIAILFEKRVD